MFGEILGAIGSQLATAVIASAPGLITGLVVKHGRRATAWIPNSLIPVFALAAGTGAGLVSGAGPVAAAGLGVSTMIGSVGIHQVTKIASRAVVDRVTKPESWIGSKLRKIGPGVELSL